jgi:hypothetical protein
MSFKTKIAAGAATFALAGGGLGAAGTLSASAATARSGSHFQHVYNLQLGPRYVMDAFQGRAVAGQKVILFRASSSDPAEDFVIKYLGKVGSLHTRTKHSPFTPQFRARYGSLQAYEFQYEPSGVNSRLCTATWPGESARPGFKVRLEKCGPASAIWAAGPTPSHAMAKPGSTFFINGATDSISRPLVLNNPSDMPRAWLNVEPLRADRNGAVSDYQRWSAMAVPAHGGM